MNKCNSGLTDKGVTLWPVAECRGFRLGSRYKSALGYLNLSRASGLFCLGGLCSWVEPRRFGNNEVKYAGEK